MQWLTVVQRGGQLASRLYLWSLGGEPQDHSEWVGWPPFGGEEMLSFADLHALHRRRFVLQSNRMLTTNTLVNVHWCPLLVIWIDLLETVSRLFLFRHVPSDSESPPRSYGSAIATVTSWMSAFGRRLCQSRCALQRTRTLLCRMRECC
jgi:hypothetical protein